MTEIVEIGSIEEKKAEEAAFQESDIFGLYSLAKRRFLLVVAAGITVLLPFSDTIYLPSLPTIEEDLNTTFTKVSLTVALYTITVGIFPLLWGPFADYFGRQKTLILTLVIFVASCIGCLLSPDITSLIVFRVIQGVGVSSVLIVSTATVSDTWPAAERGAALGLCGIPLLVGPIIGPVIGGAVANEYTWRGTFVVLIILGGIGVLVSILVFEETLPYVVFQKKVAPGRPDATNPFPKPKFLPPWMPLKFFSIPSVLILSLGLGLCFTGMFVALIILPEVLAEVYGLNELNTGLCYLPVGIGAFIGSPIGGKLADVASHKLKSSAGSLLVASITLVTMIPATIATGWYMKAEGPLGGLLALNAVTAFCFCFAMPGVQSYAVTIIPSQAGAVMGLLMLAQFGLAGILIWASSALIDLMGYGWLFTAIALLQVFSAGAVVIFALLKLRTDKADQ